MSAHLTDVTPTADQGGAPSWLLLGVEPLRAVCELASAQFNTLNLYTR